MTPLWLLLVAENVLRPWPALALSDAPDTTREARRPTRGSPEESVKAVLACIQSAIC
jgi:hypothetical protein